MSDPSFQDYIASERARLTDERGRWLDMKKEAEDRLGEVDSEFAAIEAYETAKTGKAPQPVNNTATRARRGGRREAILQAVAESPSGMSRGDLLQAFGVKGDKSGEMSVSNALTALLKSRQVSRDGGKYFLPPTPLQAAAE